jgi:hypothetical protein
MTESTSTPDLKAIARTARDPASTTEQLQACEGQGESIDRLLAKHPNASAQLLEQLSHSSDRATRKAVTLHPNTPKDALLKLAPQFPGDFFQNPAFDWLLIEHPNLMFDIGGGVLKNVLKRAECPSSFMAWAAAHGSEQERLAVSMNPQAQADVLQAIESKGGKAAQAAQQHANHPLASAEADLESAFRNAVEQAIAEGFTADDLPTLAQWPALSAGERFVDTCFEYVSHPLAPPTLTLPILSALAGDANPLVRKAVSKNAATPAASLTKLAADASGDVRCEVAKNPATPAAALIALAGDAESSVRSGVAANPATPADTVITLAGDSDAWVRQAFAFNASAPAAMRSAALATLASDSLYVRVNFACNPATPADIRLAVLTALASDPDTWARCSAAANPATPADMRAAVLSTLVDDRDPNTRRQVACNTDTPIAILAALAGDADRSVRKEVAANPSTPADILAKLGGDDDFHVRKMVAENPVTPTATLTTLAGQWAMGSEVASNPSTPAAVLITLADSVYRKEVAANPSAPAETLVRLASDVDARVRHAVAFNPSTPGDVRAAALLSLANDSDAHVRLKLAQNPATPIEMRLDALTKLACDPDSGVHFAVAVNPATPPVALTKLAGDADPELRWAVACNPATPADTAAKLVADACQEAHKTLFDCRGSERWASQVAKLKPKEAELIRACNEGDVLYLPDRLAEKACRKTGLGWRLLGLSHRFASPEDLAKRSRSTEWVERMAVARNPNTPPNIIEALRKDPHRMVARQAEATAALKSGATERQSQLLQEMPVAATDPTEQAIVGEASVRLKKLSRPNLILYGSRWASCLAPGQWLTVLGASTQAQLERMLPDSLKLAMAEFWADPAIPTAEFRAVSLPPGVLALLAQISKKKAVQEWIPFKANVPAAALARLAASKYEDVRANVARRVGTPSDVLATLSNDPVSWVRSMAVRNPAASIQLLTRLANDADANVRCGVAANPTTPADFLGNLAGDADEDVRGAVAANPSTSAASLAMLAGESRCRVGFAVAENVSAPPATLSVLAGDADAGVRSAVASNPATPPDILSGLGGDAEAAVRERVAKNPASAATTLHTLARDSSSPVRCAVAGNPAAPADVLLAMASDPDGEIRGKVAANPATPATALSALTGDSIAAVRRAVALNPATPAHFLPRLANDSDPFVSGAAACNPTTPQAMRCAVLTELAGDVNVYTRWHSAENPDTPPDALRRLARDVKWEVCLAAVSNPSAPEDILITRVEEAKAEACRAPRFPDLSRALSAESPTPEQSAAIQSWIDELQAGLAEPVVLKDVSDSEFRLAFDALGLMPPEGDKRAIAKAAKSKDWLERAAATYAPGIQPSLLKVLLEDPVEAVRQCAVARLRVVGA